MNFMGLKYMAVTAIYAAATIIYMETIVIYYGSITNYAYHGTEPIEI